MPPRKKPSKPGGGKPGSKKGAGRPAREKEAEEKVRDRPPHIPTLSREERAALAEIFREQERPRSRTPGKGGPLPSWKLRQRPQPVFPKPFAPTPKPLHAPAKRDSLFGGIVPPARVEKSAPRAQPKEKRKPKPIKPLSYKTHQHVSAPVSHEMQMLQSTYRQMLGLRRSILRPSPHILAKPGRLEALKSSEASLLQHYNEMAKTQGFKVLTSDDLTMLVKRLALQRK